MNFFTRALMALACVVSIAGCGGGGSNAGTSPFDSDSGGTTSSASMIDVLASGVQVGSAGDQVTVSAVVKDSGNVSLAKAPVSFSTDSGTLTSSVRETDSAGVATAVLSAGSDRSNRSITVTVRSGKAVGTLVLPVTGSVLSYTGPTTLGLGKTATLSIKAADSKGAAIGGVVVAIASSLNNGLSATTVTTDGEGKATLNYTATNAGADTLSFEGSGVKLTTTVQISADNFLFVDANSGELAGGLQVAVGTTQTLRVRYLVNNAPQANRVVQFTSTAGTVSNPTQTNANGVAMIDVRSNTASPATVQATIGSGASRVQTTIPIVFVASQPSKVTLQIAPTALGPNLGSATAQQARLLATVVDANANPVAGVTVNFTRLVDPSGGNLSQPSAMTDAGGQAQVQFIAGPSTTSNNGVQIRAQVAGTTVEGTTSLTVNQSALFIALGTGNVISNLDPQTYRKDWVVYVTDSNGIAVPNITLTIKVLPLAYGKGRMVFSGGWKRTSLPTDDVNCANEDDGGPANIAANAYNGILDSGEDRNGDGRLQPGNVISVTATGTTVGSSVGTFTTDLTGRATISLIYAESYVPWVDVRLSASAVVSGTESTTFADFTVTGLAADFTDQNIAPAGRLSPFGQVLNCSVAN